MGEYPVQVSMLYPEKSSRGLAIATILAFPKILILLPHFVALYIISIVAFFAWFFGQWAVLFTGTYPRSFHNFVTGSLRWRTHVSAYMIGLIDSYPPFTLR